MNWSELHANIIPNERKNPKKSTNQQESTYIFHRIALVKILEEKKTSFEGNNREKPESCQRDEKRFQLIITQWETRND
jgi:hypothetical protein